MVVFFPGGFLFLWGVLLFVCFVISPLANAHYKKRKQNSNGFQSVDVCT